MSKVPKKRSANAKFKIVLEALKGDKTILQVASEHEMHPRQILRWKDRLLDEVETIYSDKRIQQQSDPDKDKLLSIIDQLTLELDFIKKKLKRND